VVADVARLDAGLGRHREAAWGERAARCRNE